MYKKHKWLSGLRSICAFNQLRQICDLTGCLKSINLCLIANLAQCKLTGKCFEITYVSYTSRCAAYKKSPPHKQHIWFLPARKANAEKTKRAVFCQRSDRMNEI